MSPHPTRTGGPLGFLWLPGITMSLVQAFDADVFVADDAFGVVGLQGECALAEAFAAPVKRHGRFVVFENGFAVDFDRDLAVANNDVLGPPLVIFAGRQADIAEAVQAARFDPVCVADVDLAFEAGAREPFFLVGRVKIDAAIGIGLGHHVNFEFEVFEGVGVASVENVGRLTAGDKGAVFDFPGIWIVDGGFPAAESFAIENGGEAFFGIGAA